MKKIKKIIKYRGLEGLSYLKGIFGNRTNGVNVIIFAQGRTGSALLETLLASTGYFTWTGEILSTKFVEIISPYHYLKGRVSSNTLENFIFHMKIYHLTTDRKRPIDPKKFLNRLDKEGWKIIYLHRDNKVKQVISNLVAEYRGGFHKQDLKKEKIEITVDLDRFQQMMNNRLNFTLHEEEILKDIPHFSISYEDDLLDNSNHPKVVSDICEYVGLDTYGLEIETKHKKVISKSIKDIVSNFEELKNLLEENDWLHYIEDEL